jgi:hypothetical protein
MTNLSQAPIGGNEFFVSISHNISYLKSYNYDLFSFYPANRAPDHWVKIKESIEKQDLTPAQPILVDASGHIIDGQGRFMACKALNMPVYALVMLEATPSEGEGYISILNSYQKNWSTADFLTYYCQKGLEDYLKVKLAIKETAFTISTVLAIWQQSNDKHGRSTSQVFKQGWYKFNEKGLNRVRCVFSIYTAIFANKPNKVTIPNKSGLCKAIVSILTSGARLNELKTQIVKFGYLIEDCATQKQYFEMLQHIYNYKKRAKNKVVFNPYGGTFLKGGIPAKRGEIKL